MKPPETVYGPWDYAERTEQFPYEDTESYPMVGRFLSGHGLVEDWGCGVGWAKRYIDGPYRGIDGAWSQWSDEVADLRTYRSDVPCAMMRHVLEHNAAWRTVAENFTASWHDRAALVMFIPPQPEELDVGGPDFPVPDIAVSGPELFEILSRHGTRFVDVQQIWYGPEHSMQWSYECVILMER